MSLLTNLISYWKLDEASGTRVDSVGGNDLTDNNTVTQAAGKVGNAAQFTAANSEYLSHASNAALQTGNIDFTFALWVYLDSTGGQIFLSKAANGTDDEYFFYHTASRFQFWVQAGAATIKAVANSFGATGSGAWHLLIGWHDATADTLSIQIDNGTVDSVATGGAAPNVKTNQFNVGNYATGQPFYTNGRLDEIGFWKRVLTSDERTEIWNGGNGTSYPFQRSVSITGSGGVQVGGVATTKRGRAITGSGGVTIGGYGYLAIPHYLQLIVPGQRRNAIPRYETRRLTA